MRNLRIFQGINRDYLLIINGAMFTLLYLIRFIRYIKLRLKGQHIIISGSCRQCGNCCKNVSLELKGKWISSRRQFEELTNEYPEFRRFEIIGKDKAGILEFSCTWLHEDNACKDYENRLSICKQYPSKLLFLAGGNVTSSCGYTIEAGEPFARVLKKELKKGGLGHKR